MLPSGFRTSDQEAEVRRTLPVTVAGPRRILTGFPPPTVAAVYPPAAGAFAVPYPATVLAVAAVIFAGSAAGVLAARRRPNATAIADSMLSVSLWAILPVVTFFNFARFEPSAEVGRRASRSRTSAWRRALVIAWALARGPLRIEGHTRGRLHVRGVSRQHRLPRPALHGRPARARRAAGGDHLRPARVHAVAAGGRVLDRGHPSRRAARRASAACGRSSPATRRCTRSWPACWRPTPSRPTGRWTQRTCSWSRWRRSGSSRSASTRPQAPARASPRRSRGRLRRP